MARDDSIDRTALTFVVLATIFILVLAYTIFPRQEAPSASGGGQSAPAMEKK